MYERILVPTDGSEGVERAVEHAVGLAAEHGGTIRALYVVNAATFGGLPMETSWEGISSVLREEGQEAVDRVAEIGAERGVDVETRVVEGIPSRAIGEFAESEDCDLIVMGTHGRGGIDRLIMGSVTERVVRTAEQPVLTVRMASSEDEIADERATEERTPQP